MENGLTKPQPEYKADLEQKRRWLRTFESNKENEQDEAREARRYYFNKQWTDAEKTRLKRRGQQPTVRNRISRKVDFLVGVEQRMRRDPKGYGRNPQDQQSADVATASLRFICETNRWEKIASDAAHDGLVSGIGVAWVGIAPGRDGNDVRIRKTQCDRFFYDSRSVEPDFSDAKFMGVHLWMDIEDAKDQWPDHAQTLTDMANNSQGLATLRSDQDHEEQWADFEKRRIRVVEIYYQTRQGWMYCVFTGDLELEGGISPYLDEEKRPDNAYVAWSPYVDEKGDRHGVVRGMKSVQDEINHRASKILHRLSVRQIFVDEGVIDDIDEVRQQLARADGVVQMKGGEWGKNIGPIDQGQSIQGEAELLTLAYSDIENLGPNPGLIGKGGGVADQSGRAILAQRDSGMTELSPVFERLRDWKLRCYRKMWARCRQAWTNERYIRITDNPKAPEYLGINQYGIDPATGQITGQNLIGQIDVDIILDEGPDTIVMQEEILQTLAQLGDAAVGPLGRIIIELSNLPNKDMLLEMMAQATAPPQPDPVQQAAMEQEYRSNEAKIAETEAKTAKTVSDIRVAQVKTAAEITTAAQQMQETRENNQATRFKTYTDAEMARRQPREISQY